MRSRQPTRRNELPPNAQDALRSAAGDDGFVEDALWTGIGVAPSGVGAAIIGSSHQVVTKLRAYADLGIDSFNNGFARSARSSTR